jgi:Fur family peroxide stress response transcriptional regulator
VAGVHHDLEQAFAQSGLRRTPQRWDVLEFLVTHRAHATADEIYRAVNRTGVRLSRATVYNTLDALVKGGLVRQLAGDQGARFDATLHRHHHFVCDQCGSVEDIDWFDLPRQTRRSALGNRTLREYEVTFRGVCESCSKS